MTPRQLLTRFSFHDLFRSEALSEAGMENYRAWVISVGVAFVCFHLHFARLLARKYGAIAARRDFALFRAALEADELFYISASFVLALLLATLQWQSLFPGERDNQVLGPLPIRRSDIFLARIAALGLFLAIFLLTFNLPPAVIFPALSGGPFPLAPLGRRILAHIFAGFGASLGAFFAVLALQGLTLIAVPHRWRSRVSFLLQSTLLVAAIALIPIVWHMPGLHRLLASRAPWLGWVPGVWWVGLCEALSGTADAWHSAMANRALTALALAAAISAGTYALLYRRFADFASPPRPVSSTPSPLLFLARRDDGGVLAFLVWTLFRSAQHRLIFAAIAAVGFSLALDGFISGYIRQWTRGRSAEGFLAETSLALPLLLNFGLVVALRMSFRIPHEWRAHWIFRLTEHAPSRPAQLEATAIAMYTFALAPSLLAAIPFQLLVLGPGRTLAALPLLIAFGACLIEYALQDWQRLPFTATYAPGHQPAAITFVIFLASFILFGSAGAAVIHSVSARPHAWLVTMLILGGAATILRRKRRAHWGHEPFSFSDDGGPAVLVTNFAPE